MESVKKPEPLMTDAQLSRWNHIRERAGLEPIDKDFACRMLKGVPKKDMKEILDRIGEK